MVQIGKYVVVKQLGAGAMGVVYLAEHPTLSQRVAIKLINAKLVHNKELGDRFINEARAASQIGHPGIVAVHDFDTDPGTEAPFIVMELLEGQDLGDYLAKTGAASTEMIRDIGMQIADALSAAHAKRIIHRDLKPDNIFLCPDSAVIGGTRAKVLDFGIAKLADATQITRGGSLMGTPMYMSPEQTTGADKVDQRSDVYSLGCILYQMAVGEVPYPGARDLNELFECHRSVPLQPAHARNPAVSEPLSAVIAACVAKSPADRPQTMAAVRARLAEAVPGGQPVNTATATETARKISQSAPAAAKSRAPLIIGASVAGLAILGGLVLLGADRDKPAAPDKPDDPVPVTGANADATPAPDPAAALNRWIRIEVPDLLMPLAVPDGVPEDRVGLRPTMLSPTAGFEIQEHEVTFGEFMPWFVGSPYKAERLPNLIRLHEREPREVARHPAVGMSFAIASAYCGHIGARLPTAEEWEWTARGPELRSEPWGEGERPISMLPDSMQLPDVMSAAEDRTPEGVYDLAGSVFELTADTFSDPDDPQKLSRYVFIRGADPQPGSPTSRLFSAIQHAVMCADGPCAADENMFKIRGMIGFRCAR